MMSKGTLRIGILRNSKSIEAHAWVEKQERVYSISQGHQKYESLMQFEK